MKDHLDRLVDKLVHATPALRPRLSSRFDAGDTLLDDGPGLSELVEERWVPAGPRGRREPAAAEPTGTPQPEPPPPGVPDDSMLEARALRAPEAPPAPPQQAAEPASELPSPPANRPSRPASTAPVVPAHGESRTSPEPSAASSVPASGSPQESQARERARPRIVETWLRERTRERAIPTPEESEARPSGSAVPDRPAHAVPRGEDRASTEPADARPVATRLAPPARARATDAIDEPAPEQVQTPAAGEHVHIHIDRLEVQAGVARAAPAQARPAGRQRAAPELEAYLEQLERGG